MAKHKTVNWAAIKKRYLQGEKPKDIAADYGLTAKQVSNKAQAENWTSKKQEILAKVEGSVLKDLEEICTLYGALIKDTAVQLIEARRAGLMGITTQDGEAFADKFALNDHKAGLACYIERQKHIHKLQLAELGKVEPDGEVTPGFNVSPDA